MTENPVTVHEDGTVLRGTAWVTPDAYLEQDIASGLLVALKGATPIELPELNLSEAIVDTTHDASRHPLRVEPHTGLAKE